MEIGLSANRTFVVTANDTAYAVGSGSLAVLGTPRLLAWCEAVTCEALSLPDGQTSVGVYVSLDHVAPTAVGGEVAVKATVTDVVGRRVIFSVEAEAASGPVGNGVVERVVVDAERFMSRVP